VLLIVEALGFQVAFASGLAAGGALGFFAFNFELFGSSTTFSLALVVGCARGLFDFNSLVYQLFLSVPTGTSISK
jgi:hypothetical protein